MAELARWNADGTLTVFDRTVRERLDLRDLLASDGMTVDCLFSFGLHAVDRPADRRMLEEVFRSRGDVVRTSDVTDHIRPALKTAAGRVVATKPASAWMSEPDLALRDALVDAARAACFTSGVNVIAPFDVQLRSPAVERAKVGHLQEKLAEQHAGSRRERLKQSADVMAEFVRLREQAPEVPPGKLLEQIDQANGAGLLETLLLASANSEASAQTLHVIAGSLLIALSSDDGIILNSIALPEELGPFRSVTRATHNGETVLLNGARSGVVLRPTNTTAEATLYRTTTASQVGFNRAAIFNGRLYASHGEAQLACWELSRPDEPITRVEPVPNGHPRHLMVVSDQLLVCSSGKHVALLSPDHSVDVVEMDSEVMELLPAGLDVLAVTSDGAVHRIDAANRAIRNTVRVARSVTAAALLPWLDEPRLLLGTGDGPILCIGLNDSLVRQYASAHRGFRTIAASQRSVVALTGDRQRLVFWDTWDGRKPAHETHIAQRFGHRVADLCFA